MATLKLGEVQFVGNAAMERTRTGPGAPDALQQVIRLVVDDIYRNASAQEGCIDQLSIHVNVDKSFPAFRQVIAMAEVKV